MESLFILIPLSVVAIIVAVVVFFRMNADGQFDDAQGPAWSILMDDDNTLPDDSSEDERISDS